MGALQHGAGRFATQDEDPCGRIQAIGRIGLAAVELADLLEFARSRNVTPQPVGQPVQRQLMAGADRTGAFESGLSGHGGYSV
ncbi:hypothetical protein D3C87_1770430 [compost metagenome]